MAAQALQPKAAKKIEVPFPEGFTPPSAFMISGGSDAGDVTVETCGGDIITFVGIPAGPFVLPVLLKNVIGSGLGKVTILY
jgi:hypothetical protein